MDNVFLVRGFKGGGDLLHNRQRIPAVDPGFDFVVQGFAAGQKLHHKVVVPVMLSNIVNCNDIWMCEIGNNTCLSYKPVAVLGICPGLTIQHLDRHFPIQSLVNSKVDARHAAFADFFFDLVAGYFHKLKQGLNKWLLIRAKFSARIFRLIWYGV